MTAHALIIGALFRAPERKISRSGKPYVSATIKCRDGEGLQFWRITIFSESACEELMRLQDGDGVSAQGAMKAELYRPENGEPRISLSLVADQVLALRQPPRKREKRAAAAPNASPRHIDRATGQRRITGRRSPFAPHGAFETDSNLADDVPF